MITRYFKKTQNFLFFFSFHDTKWIWITRKGKTHHLDFGTAHDKQDTGLIICIVRMDFLLSISSSYCSSIRLYDKRLDVLAYIWDVKGHTGRIDQRQCKPSTQFRVPLLACFQSGREGGGPLRLHFWIMVLLPPFSPKTQVYAFPKESGIACRYGGYEL